MCGTNGWIVKGQRESDAAAGRTDGEGRFRLEGLLPGQRYDLYFKKDKPSLSGTLLKGFIGKPGEVRDLGDVKGKPFRED